MNVLKNKIAGIFFLLLLFSSVSHAEEATQQEDAIGDKPSITECEKEMVKAFNTADYEFQTHYAQLLELPDMTAVAKSSTGNIESYINTYQCHLDTICPTVINAMYQHLDQKVSFLINQCEMNGKTEFSINDVSQMFKADLSKCALVNETQEASQIAERCARMQSLKKSFTENYAKKELIKEENLENNSFISLKLLDINKKLDTLIEKVQTFIVHFKKVNDDISCINPDSTGAR